MQTPDQNMNTSTSPKAVKVLSSALLLIATSTHADTFGTLGNEFTIDFAEIGTPGNPNDSGAGGGSYSSNFGGVGYAYRMGVTEVAQDWVTRATASGLAHVTSGPWGSNQPATNVSWYDAAAFVNFLNTSTGHQAAYNLDFTSSWTMQLWNSADAWQADGENLYRHRESFYFLPSENEWYKAAFQKNDGPTPNYWDYATGSNFAPVAVASGTLDGTAVYQSLTPADVNLAGGLSSYGIQGQGGNVWEWQESSFNGTNDSPSLGRTIRGGYWPNNEVHLRSSDRTLFGPATSVNNIGFRVASIPEPSTIVFTLGAGSLLLIRRRRSLA